MIPFILTMILDKASATYLCKRLGHLMQITSVKRFIVSEKFVLAELCHKAKTNIRVIYLSFNAYISSKVDWMQAWQGITLIC